MTVTSRPSIRQVAETAGVSRMTVSRVLSDRNGSAVAEETRQRVLQAVRELEYVPVPQPAMQSRHIETRIIGLVFDDAPLESSWGLPTFQGMREAAIEHDYDLLTMLRTRPDWMANREELQFLDRRSDGFIFIAPQNRRQTLEILVRHQWPAVACYTEDVPSKVPTIVLDNRDAMRQSVEHLIAHGHQRILHLTTALNRSDFQQRLEGFKQAMQQARLEPFQLCVQNITQAADAQAFLQIIRGEHITAVACAADGLAYCAWDIAEANGIKVPSELSLTGLDDMAKGDSRPLTTIHYSCEEVGKRAVEATLALIQGKKNRRLNSIVPVNLVARASVAEPA